MRSLRRRRAASACRNTDTITDFSKGSDLIGLYSGLSFGQLSFSGNNILVTSTNEISLASCVK
ncbi:hypothetical protein FACHB389_30705 [Nostoc calcicola FACHB-389]|nr:hypothetical protein FACHB389_30705 [Nostoc calcicola FACHB-389]